MWYYYQKCISDLFGRNTVINKCFPWKSTQRRKQNRTHPCVLHTSDIVLSDSAAVTHKDKAYVAWHLFSWTMQMKVQAVCPCSRFVVSVWDEHSASTVFFFFKPYWNHNNLAKWYNQKSLVFRQSFCLDYQLHNIIIIATLGNIQASLKLTSVYHHFVQLSHNTGPHLMTLACTGLFCLSSSPE